MRNVLVRKPYLCMLMVLGVILAPGIFAQVSPSGTQETDAKLAKYFEFYSSLPTIEERIARATNANAGRKPDEIVIATSRVQMSTQNVDSALLPHGSDPLLLEALLACDLAVMGTPVAARSLLISNETFIFTQYKFLITRVFLDDGRVVSPGDTIVVSMGGGSLIVNDVLVKAVDPAFDQFRLNEPLILMLKAVPGTGTYRAVAPWTFEIKSGVVSVASKIQPGRGAAQKNLPAFLSDLEGAVVFARSRRK